jgi:transcription elongation factor Elf1
MNNRYLDEGFSLLYWATQIEAVCPKCNDVGVVSGNPSWKDWRATFLCRCCSYSLKTERNSWHGPVLGMGRRPCGTCGHQWVRIEKLYDDATKIKSESAKTKCPQCKSGNEVFLTFTRAEPVDHAIDPFFGLELALKEDTRNGTVWVYDATHLEQLKLYVSAQLREGDGTKWSYFTRLPKWLKTSKNRELVLKAISKLEKRLMTKPSI